MAMDFAALGRFVRTFEPGEMIFSEFEPGDTFYLIQSGRVELVKIIGDIEKTLDILQPSEMFGEMSILEKSPRSATAIALDTVKVLEFNSQNFEILMMGNPQIALKLLRVFCKRIYDSKRRYMILTLPDAAARVADVFLMLDEAQFNTDNRKWERREFNVAVSDVAHWAGLSTIDTQEAMRQFVNQHRLEIHPDKVVVTNINDFIRLVNSRRRK